MRRRSLIVLASAFLISLIVGVSGAQALLLSDGGNQFGIAPLPGTTSTIAPAFVVPSAVNNGDVIEFDGSKTISSLIVQNAGYVWTFGDGTTAVGPSVVHTYAYGGTYSVTLTVTDRGGYTASLTQAHPAASTVSRTATFRFVDTDRRVVVYRCSLDGREGNCRSPQGFSNLAIGRHTFRVYAVAGTLHSGTAQYVWTVMYPAPRITGHPAGRTRSRTAAFGFTYGTRAVTFKCRVDKGGPWRICKSPTRYAYLARNRPGRSYAFEVSATVHGKISQVASFSWTIVKC
jgi:hypothetical protein